jgi:hypothetical protein
MHTRMVLAVMIRTMAGSLQTTHGLVRVLSAEEKCGRSGACAVRTPTTAPIVLKSVEAFCR